MKTKLLKILRNILIGIVAFIVVFLLGVRIGFRAPVHSYYKVSKKAFVIPGLKDGYIAQGLSYDSSTDNFFLTGYMTDHSASPIYVVNKTSKKLVKEVRMANSDGSDFTGHAGGLSVIEDKIYIAGSADECLYVFNKNDVLKADNKASIKVIDIVDVKTSEDGIGVAFTTVNDGLIYVGEFYREGPYPTRDSHKVTTSTGFNKALAVGFSLNENIATPEVVYSIPANIQGMCFAEDGIYLSESWGPAFSYIHKYNYTDIKQKGTFVTLGKEVPLYILEPANEAKTFKIASMSEEIEYIDGSVYISNESASNKYKFGKFTGGKWCLAAKFE